MPGDNKATVGAGEAVQFPQDGPEVGSGIERDGKSQFKLKNEGVYLVSFNVSVTEAGQLVIRIDGKEIDSTVSGRATGTSIISQTCLIKTKSSNSILEIVNPADNSTALTITPKAGGTKSVSAHLVITRYS
jgi:hypothetical protein